MIRTLLMAAAVAGVGAMSAAKANDVNVELGLSEARTYRVAPGLAATSRYYRDVLAPAEPRRRQTPAVRAAPSEPSDRSRAKAVLTRLLREDQRRRDIVGRDSLR